MEFHDWALGIGKVFGQESTVVKWNYQILSLHLVTVCQKVPILDFQSEFSMSKIIEVNKVYTLICCTAWVLILYFSLLMTSKKIWALCYLDNVTKYIHSSSSSKCISTCLVPFWWQDFCVWMTLPTVYLCYIVIPDCGHDKIDTCQFVENITNINLLPFPKP